MMWYEFLKLEGKILQLASTFSGKALDLHAERGCKHGMGA